MDKLRNKFMTLEKELRNNETFSDAFLFLSDGAEESLIIEVENKLGLKLPNEIRSFYKSINGLSLAWSYYKKEDNGVITFAKATVYVPDLEAWVSYPQSKSVPEMLLLMLKKGYFLIDDFGFGNYTLLKIDENGYELFLLQQDGSIDSLPISFERYFHKLVETGGMFFWQMYLIANLKLVFDHLLQDDFILNMGNIFPKAELGDYYTYQLFEQNNLTYVLDRNDYPKEFQRIFLNLPNYLEGPTKLKMKIHGVGLVRKAEAVLGTPLPNSLRAFYLRINGISIRWRHKFSEKHWITANFSILPLEKVLGGVNGGLQTSWKHSAIEYYGISLVDFPEMQGVYVFYLDSEGDIGFKIDNGSYQLYLITDEYTITPLKIGMEEFFDELFNTRGMRGWQVQLAGIYDDSFLEDLQEIFPEADPSLYLSS